MLILKSDKDLPISVRHLGHQIGANTKTLETSLHSDIDQAAYKKLIYLADQHIFNMRAIGRSIKELGNEETFDLTRVYGRLEYLEEDYHKSATDLLDLIKEARSTTEDEALEPILIQSYIQADRKFKDDIQISSVNRMEKLQDMIESNSLSFIAGLMKLDLSAMNYAELIGPEIYQEINALIEDLNDEILIKIKDEEITSIKDLQNSIDAAVNDEFAEILEVSYQECAKDLVDIYNDKFVANESLEELKANAINVIKACLGRGKPKQYLHGLVESLIEEYVDNVSKMHGLT